MSIEQDFGVEIDFGKEDAFFIIPCTVENGGVQIFHQYGCVCCRHLNITGIVQRMPKDVADKFSMLLGCDYKSPQEVSEATGFEVTSTDEALATLRDGRYVVTENCD